MNTTPNDLEMRETGTGVAEVYAGDHQVGMITWNPGQMTSRWYATYANGDETADCDNRYEALEHLRLQHAVVERLARSIRSIRPAPEVGHGPQKLVDQGYNNALRDVERLLQEVVGRAPEGEGYTAITEQG